MRWSQLFHGALSVLPALRSSFLTSESPGAQEPAQPAFQGEGRFVPGAALARKQLLDAAEGYVQQKSESERRWLYAKPYDPTPGNAGFFTEMYQVLNLLQAMRITPGGRVLEVGSGPGWVTEILALLRFEVVAVEPSSEMIAIAKERLAAAERHFRPAQALEVTFVPRAIEDCDLPGEAFDAVVFHESLHHVLDERETLRICFEALRDGGILGVSEWAWRPGDVDLERGLMAEMERFGTLESPYQPGYLDLILRETGFSEIRRYHAINGFFEVSQGDQPLQGLAQAHAASTNNVTARKPGLPGMTSADVPERTSGRVTVLGCDAAGPNILLKLGIANTGETTWLPQAPRAGFVRLGLRAQGPGDAVEEVAPSIALEHPVAPGQSLEMDVSFRPFSTPGNRPLEVGLVLERFSWFATAALSLL